LGYGRDATIIKEAKIYFDDFIEQLGWKALQGRSADRDALFILSRTYMPTPRLSSASV
jgi:hypothetical protein